MRTYFSQVLAYELCVACAVTDSSYHSLSKINGKNVFGNYAFLRDVKDKPQLVISPMILQQKTVLQVFYIRQLPMRPYRKPNTDTFPFPETYLHPVRRELCSSLPKPDSLAWNNQWI